MYCKKCYNTKENNYEKKSGYKDRSFSTHFMSDKKKEFCWVEQNINRNTLSAWIEKSPKNPKIFAKTY